MRVFNSPRKTKQNEAALHAEIAARYAAHNRRWVEDTPLRRLAYLRLYDIENILEGRTSHPISEWDYLTIAANHIAFTKSNSAAKIVDVVDWARCFTPSLPIRKVRGLAKRIIANPCMWSADKLAWRMRLTFAERTAFGVKTIGSIDKNKEQRAALRKQKDAEAARLRRAEKSTGRPGGRPSRGKPWLAEGISCAQWFRNARDDETKPRRQYCSVATYNADALKSHPVQRGTSPGKKQAGGTPTARHSTTDVGNLSKVIMARWMLPWMQRQSGENLVRFVAPPHRRAQ